MSFNSLISDFVCRFKQAIISRKVYASCRKSKLVLNILNKLKNYGYISFFKEVDGNNIVFALQFSNEYPLISDIKICSKSSRRVFTGYKEIDSVKNRFNIAILSTNKGILFCTECKKLKVGGELLIFMEV